MRFARIVNGDLASFLEAVCTRAPQHRWPKKSRPSTAALDKRRLDRGCYERCAKVLTSQPHFCARRPCLQFHNKNGRSELDPRAIETRSPQAHSAPPKRAECVGDRLGALSEKMLAPNPIRGPRWDARFGLRANSTKILFGCSCLVLVLARCTAISGWSKFDGCIARPNLSQFHLTRFAPTTRRKPPGCQPTLCPRHFPTVGHRRVGPGGQRIEPQ